MAKKNLKKILTTGALILAFTLGNISNKIGFTDNALRYFHLKPEKTSGKVYNKKNASNRLPNYLSECPEGVGGITKYVFSDYNKKTNKGTIAILSYFGDNQHIGVAENLDLGEDNLNQLVNKIQENINKNKPIMIHGSNIHFDLSRYAWGNKDQEKIREEIRNYKWGENKDQDIYKMKYIGLDSEIISLY